MSYPTNPPWVPSCASTGAGVEVPDATATRFTVTWTQQGYKVSRPNIEEAEVVLASDYDAAQAALTAAKAEIARLNENLDRLTCVSVDAQTRAERAEAQLRERTQWQCACGGTDCAGQAENQQLRAEVERLKTDNGALRATFNLNPSAAYSQIDQLRARVADLENDLEKSKHEADDWHRAWETVTEQAKKEVAELEADKARLVEVAHDAVSFVGAANYRERQDEAHEMIDAARAGKGAT